MLEEMGCPPNVVTCTIVLQALGKAKDINEALEVQEKMKRNGVVPDSSFHSSLIYIAGRIKDAHDDMPEQGAMPFQCLDCFFLQSLARRGSP